MNPFIMIAVLAAPFLLIGALVMVAIVSIGRSTGRSRS
jgi:hypothetical protein